MTYEQYLLTALLFSTVMMVIHLITERHKMDAINQALAALNVKIEAVRSYIANQKANQVDTAAIEDSINKASDALGTLIQ